MTFRDAATHLRALAVQRARRMSCGAEAELIPLAVAAALAYANLVDDAGDVAHSEALQDRLDHMALALSAVAQLYSRADGFTRPASRSEPAEQLLMRRRDLPIAIETLRRAGVAFSG